MKKEIHICDRCGSKIEDLINDLSIVDICSPPKNIARLKVELCECCIDDIMQFLYGYEVSENKVCKPFPGSDLAKEEGLQMQNTKLSFADEIIYDKMDDEEANKDVNKVKKIFSRMSKRYL